MSRPSVDLPEPFREAIAEGGSAPDAEQALEIAARLADALPVVDAGAESRARLLAKATTGPARWAPFFEKLEQLFDVNAARLAEILERAQDAAAWDTKSQPGLRLFDLDGGPAVAGADLGLLEIPAGIPFPEHTHLGEERLLVLEGGYRDSTGKVYRAGDLLVMPAGSSHSYEVLPERAGVFATVIFEGITVGGVRVR